MLKHTFFARMGKKKTVLLALCLVLILATVGGTVAYLVVKTNSQENTFEPTTVDSAPVRTAAGGVAVQNTGATTAYVRAAIVFDWVVLDENGNPTSTHYSYEPQINVDYTIAYGNANGWVKGSDGYWYYTRPVAAGATTPELILSYERVGERHPGYQLSMEVITSGLQATPERVASEVWGVSVVGGILTPN